MVAAPRWFAKVVLPQMAHLVRQGTKNLHIGSTIERVRVERNFGCSAIFSSVLEPVGAEEASRLGVAVERNQALW